MSYQNMEELSEEVCILTALPREVLGLIARHEVLSAVDLLAFRRVCTACRNVAAPDDEAWELLLVNDFRPMIDAFFGGAVPLPRGGLTWMEHYFDFAQDWKRLAQDRTERILVQIGEQSMSGRQRYECKSILSLFTEWNRADPARYGVYDVTDFIEVHPGAELYDFGRATDATDMFDMAVHSDEAVRRLRTLAVSVRRCRTGLAGLAGPNVGVALHSGVADTPSRGCAHAAAPLCVPRLRAACRSVVVNVRCPRMSGPSRESL